MNLTIDVAIIVIIVFDLYMLHVLGTIEDVIDDLLEIHPDLWKEDKDDSGKSD